MRRSGRVSLVALMAIIAVVMVGFVFFFSQESLSSVGGRFMDALARGNVKTLTDLTYLGKESPAQIREQWQFATQVAGKNYPFEWRILSESHAGPNSGSVRMEVVRNLGSPASYPEDFELPMIKLKDGTWKVDVAGISRELYPGLPKD